MDQGIEKGLIRFDDEDILRLEIKEKLGKPRRTGTSRDISKTRTQLRANRNGGNK